MPPVVETITSPPLETNVYIVADPDAGKALAIDVSCVADRILEVCREKGWTLETIVLTHGHIDHICEVPRLAKETGAAVLAHEASRPLLSDADKCGASVLGFDFEPVKPDRLLRDGDVVECGALRFEVLHTPGHAPGSICLLGEGLCFTGDLLFRDGIGRWDLPGGDPVVLRESMKALLDRGDDAMTVFSGHGPSTTLGRERARNPYLLDWFGE